MKYTNSTVKVRNIKIQTRLIIAFFFLSITPLIITSLISYSMSSRAIQDKIESYSAQVMLEVSNNLTTYLTRFESLCEEIEMTEEIQKGLSEYQNVSNIKKYEIEDKIYLKFIEKMRLSSFGASSEIVSINVVTATGTIIGAGQNYYNSEQLIKISDLPVSSKYKYSYSLINDLNGNYNIAVKKVIKNHKIGGTLGTIILTFKESYISEFCKHLDMKGNADVFTVNSNGTIISSSNHLKIPINKTYLEKSLVDRMNISKEAGKFSFSTYINGEKKMVVYNSVKNCDWFIVSSIPYSYLQKESKYIMWSIIVIGLLTTAIMIFIIIVVINISVKKPLNEISNVSHYLADGNLRINFNDESKDEVGKMSKDLNNFLKKLVEIIDNASKIKLNINETADNLNSGNKLLLDKIINQSASLLQIAATMDEITHNVTNNFIKIKEMYSITKDAERKISSMESSSNNLNNSMLEIEKSSLSIEDTINFVQNISFQIKLLAINSSVAAARSGEAGKEFAEIALEIRELSKISANAVKEIKTKVRDNENNIIQGKQSIQETLETIKKVSEKMTEIYEFISEISTGADEEKNAIMQITDSVNEISDITQHISSMAHEVSEIAAFLKKETKHLSDIFSFFKLD